MPRAILFDLDGTLVQARESSWRVFQKTNARFDLGIDTQEEYFRLLDGNMFDSLSRVAGSDDHADTVVGDFLERLKQEYDPPLIPGIVDVIKCLAGTAALAVVSSNAMVTIRRVLDRAGLAHCFSHVFGGDVEPDKRACVRRFLADADYSINRQCSPAYVEDHRPENVAEHQVVLVTDTVGDISHAVECGVRAVGVAWGMHSEDRLRAAGAEFVAVWPQELLSHLAPGGVTADSCAFAAPGSGAQTGGHAACGCDGHCSCGESLDAELAAVAGLRHNRTLAAAGQLASRLSASASVARQHPSGSGGADDLLMTSLKRIRENRKHAADS